MQLSPRRMQRGITLLESLISIVIVALGILGILGVQLRTLADTQTAVRRAQAIRLTEDLSERIKVNPNALGADVLANYVVDWGPAASSVPQDCALSAGCTAANLALYDIARWKRTVRSTMPLGDASVFLVADETNASNPAASNRRQLGVMISWRENERVQANDSDTKYRAVFAVPAASAASAAATVAVGCPADHICHLQYIQPTARCATGGNNAQGLCP